MSEIDINLISILDNIRFSFKSKLETYFERKSNGMVWLILRFLQLRHFSKRQ